MKQANHDSNSPYSRSQTRDHGATRPANDGRALFESLLSRSSLLLTGAITAALAAAAFGWQYWSTTYTASAQVVRYDSPNNEEVFRPRDTPAQTFVLMLRSPKLVRYAAERMQPRVSAEELAARLQVVPEFNSDLLTISVTDSDPERAVELVNLYAREGVRYTQEQQSADAAEVAGYLESQMKRIDQRLQEMKQQWTQVQLASIENAAANAAAAAAGLAAPAPTTSSSPADTSLTPMLARLNEAQQTLIELQSGYTDAHPAVQRQKAVVAGLMQTIGGSAATRPSALNPSAVPAVGSSSASAPTVNRMSAAGSSIPSVTVTPAVASVSAPRANPVLIDAQSDPELLRRQLESLDNDRAILATRLNAARLFEQNPPGYLRLFAEASVSDVAVDTPYVKIASMGLLGGLLGLVFFGGLILTDELRSSSLKTVDDVERVTQLPVIATAGNLARMNPSEQALWAFRSWTVLQNRLERSPGHGFVCGFTASNDGEDRATWVNLLARAANQRGFRVLTISHQPLTGEPAAPRSRKPAIAGVLGSNAPAAVFANPADIAQRLASGDRLPIVHIPLPDGGWDLDRRRQWKAAIEQWSRIEDLVILIELPPASQPEAILLAEGLPNLIWLVDSGQADATDTRRQIETLHHAEARLVGAVVNREPPAPLQRLFPRWLQPSGNTPAFNA